MRTVWLPMAMAQDLDVSFHLKQPVLSARKFIATRKEIACQGLRVRVAQPPSRAERLAEEVMRANSL